MKTYIIKARYTLVNAEVGLTTAHVARLAWPASNAIAAAIAGANFVRETLPDQEPPELIADLQILVSEEEGNHDG